MQTNLKSLMNKKAISPVIAVVLIVLISIASVSILSFYLIRISEKPSDLAPKVVSCIEIQQSPPKIQSACMNSQTNRLEVAVKRSPIDEYTAILGFFVESTGQTDVYECGASCSGKCTLPAEGSTKKYYFDISYDLVPDEVRLYVNSNDCEVDSVNIVPC